MKLSWEGTDAKNVRFNNKGVINAVNILKNQGVITWVRGYELKINIVQYKTSCRVVRTKSPNAKAKTGAVTFSDSNLGEALLKEGSTIYYGDTINIEPETRDNLNKISANIIYTYLNGTTKTETISLDVNGRGNFTVLENNLSTITVDVIENHVVGWHDVSMYIGSSTLGEATNLIASNSSDGKCYTKTFMYSYSLLTTTNTKPTYNAPIRVYGGYILLDDTDSSNETLYVGKDVSYGDKQPEEFTGGTFTRDFNYVPSDRDICDIAVEIKDARTSSLPNQLQITHHKTTNSSGSKVVKVTSISVDIQVYY